MRKFNRDLVIAALAVPLMFLLYFLHQNSTRNSLASFAGNAAPLYQQGKANSSLPVRLKIPRINTNAAIEYVGLAKDGSVGVPTGPSGAAWFNLSPRPGEIGSSVIDGHSGWRNNIPAIFDNLYKLQKGDKIYIEDENGQTITFVVRELRTYGLNKKAPDVFSSSDGKAHLNLITCAGIWNVVRKSHSDRLVVFTDRETN